MLSTKTLNNLKVLDVNSFFSSIFKISNSSSILTKEKVLIISICFSETELLLFKNLKNFNLIIKIPFPSIISLVKIELFANPFFLLSFI